MKKNTREKWIKKEKKKTHTKNIQKEYHFSKSKKIKHSIYNKYLFPSQG